MFNYRFDCYTERKTAFNWTNNQHIYIHICPSLWPSGIGSRLGWNRLWVRFLAVSDIYPMFIEPTLLGSLRGSLGTYGLTQKLCWKKKNIQPFYFNIFLWRSNNRLKIIFFQHNFCIKLCTQKTLKGLHVYEHENDIYPTLPGLELATCSVTNESLSSRPHLQT